MTTANRRAGSPRQRLIAPALLARLDNLELVARTVVDGVLGGLHRSHQFGFSQEFAEYRTYAPGDDLRFVDWNVYARGDRLVVKRFFGTTNTQIIAMIDASASMAAFEDAESGDAIGKIDYARYIAAALAYLGNAQHDAVGYLAFHDDSGEFHPPSTRAIAVERLYHALDALEAHGVTNWDAAFQQLDARLTRRSLLVILSDFYCEPEALRSRLQSLAGRGHETLLIHLQHPLERQPGRSGIATLQDAETGAVMEVSETDLRTGYAERFAAHESAIREAAGAAGSHYVRIATDEPLDIALSRYLTFRARHP